VAHGVGLLTRGSPYFPTPSRPIPEREFGASGIRVGFRPRSQRRARTGFTPVSLAVAPFALPPLSRNAENRETPALHDSRPIRSSRLTHTQEKNVP